jgi:hypothetical protein
VSCPISTCPTSVISHIYLPNKCHIPYLLAQKVSHPIHTCTTSVIPYLPAQQVSSHIYLSNKCHIPMTSGPTTVSLTSQWQVAQLQCHSHPTWLASSWTDLVVELQNNVNRRQTVEHKRNDDPRTLTLLTLSHTHTAGSHSEPPMSLLLVLAFCQ